MRQHFYFCRAANNASLRSNQPIDPSACGLSAPVNDDVRVLAFDRHRHGPEPKGWVHRLSG